MNEGGMIKMYVDKKHINEAEVASAIGVQEGDMSEIYKSQTVDADIKKKLQALFDRNIFDGSLLTEFDNDVPDQKANKAKD